MLDKMKKYFGGGNFKKEQLNVEKIGVFMEIPQCISPWVYLGLGWGKFGICCNSYNMDFGDITKIEASNNFINNIFNSESYILMRKSLSEGLLNENCQVCPQRMYGAGGIHQIVNQYTDILLQIKDEDQRNRARDNFAQAIEAVVLGKIEVSHTPSFLIFVVDHRVILGVNFAIIVGWNMIQILKKY